MGPDDHDDGTHDDEDENEGEGDDNDVDSETPPVPDDTLAALAAFCDGQVDALCRGAAPCDCPGSGDDGCATRQRLACETALAPLTGAVVLGNVDFDPALGAACIADTLTFAESCAPPTFSNRPRSCLDAFRDRAALGENCTRYSTGLLCADGLGACASDGPTPVCGALPSSMQRCAGGRCGDGLSCDAGVCVTRADEGGQCASDAGCANGLICGPWGTCGSLVTSGEACSDTNQCADGLTCRNGLCDDGPSAGDSCDASNPLSCASGDTCLPSAEPTACAPRAAEGEACPRYDDCTDGLICDFTSAVPTCRAAPAAGSACVAGQCGPGAGCNGDGICEVLPGAGGACLFASPTPCAPGFGCDYNTGLCAAAGAEGAECVGGACLSGLVCNFLALPVCQQPGAVGSTCTGDNVCAQGLYCDFATSQCAEPAANGSPCESDAACVAGSGCIFDGSSNVCAPIPGDVGATCDQRCGGGLRCALPPGTCAAGVCSLVN